MPERLTPPPFVCRDRVGVRKKAKPLLTEAELAECRSARVGAGGEADASGGIRRRTSPRRTVTPLSPALRSPRQASRGFVSPKMQSPLRVKVAGGKPTDVAASRVCHVMCRFGRGGTLVMCGLRTAAAARASPLRVKAGGSAAGKQLGRPTATRSALRHEVRSLEHRGRQPDLFSGSPPQAEGKQLCVHRGQHRLIPD